MTQYLKKGLPSLVIASLLLAVAFAGDVTGFFSNVASAGYGGDKVTICHKTGSAKKPYNEITVSKSAVKAHQGHGDIIPAPPTGCPTA